MAGAMDKGHGLDAEGTTDGEGVVASMVVAVEAVVEVVVSVVMVVEVIAVVVEEGTISTGVCAAPPSKPPAAPTANADVRASRCAGERKGGSAMENPPMTPRPRSRSRSGLTGMFDWARSDLTGATDWARSGLSGSVSLSAMVTVSAVTAVFLSPGMDKALRAATSQCIRPAGRG